MPTALDNGQRSPRKLLRALIARLLRCSLCPLFDAERAIRDMLGENPLPATVLEITLGPNLRALLRGELPPDPGEDPEPDWEVPDFPPEAWGEPPREEPPG